MNASMASRTASALSDELLGEIAIIGSRDYCQQRIREYSSAGVQTHILCCPLPEPQFQDETFRAFTPSFFDY